MYRAHPRRPTREEEAERVRLEVAHQIKEQLAVMFPNGVPGQQGQAGDQVVSPGAKWGSCASTDNPPPELDTARYAVDDITTHTPCTLHVPLQSNITQEIARGVAHPICAGQIIHGVPLHAGHSRVEVEDMPSQYRGYVLQFPPEEGVDTLGTALHNLIVWLKCYIIIMSNDGAGDPGDGASSPSNG
ncbi:Os02g0472350 [Oryza sativa Japonica Group]|uniref:Os02g0472350 protein n=1 Tax=Oryza sativa subsp. japonica TaxID=39947 RepID=A0A0P0VIX8_ORYSJ|nr:Os02g0472350 [Oryza sativa Japonica Group]